MLSVELQSLDDKFIPQAIIR